MLAELLEQDHRQRPGPGPAPGDHMERGRRLADLLAIPTGELFPYRFDHLPLPRDHLQRPGHILAQLAQPRSAAALARRRLGNHHALARQVVGEGVSLGALAREAATFVVFATAISAASSSSLALAANSSNCSAS